MPQNRSSSPSLGNILAFVAIFVFAMFVYPWLAKQFFPNPQAAPAPAANNEKKPENPQQKQNEEKVAEARKRAGPKPAEEPVEKSVAPAKLANAETPAPAGEAKPKAVEAAALAPANEGPLYVTLGSVDPDLKQNPYRMGITFSRRGAALARLELSSERYRDLDDRSGYLGHLVMDRSDRGPGCLVQAVVAGTPAAKAGIKPGDRIMAVSHRGRETQIEAPDGLEEVLRTTDPKDRIELTVRPAPKEPEKGGPQAGAPPAKDNAAQKLQHLTATLIRRPLEVVRPERRMPNINWIRNGPTDAINLADNCPLSFLTTLQQVDEAKLPTAEDAKLTFEEDLAQQLPGVNLRDALWTIESPPKGVDANAANKVVFSCDVPKYDLKITKTYELAKVDDGGGDDPAYHLTLTLAITNLDKKNKHEVAYRQDGPNGLPIEGSWYAYSKVGRTWSTEGLRDVDYQVDKGDVGVVTCSQLSEKAADKTEKFRRDIGESSEFAQHPPRFFAVDAQYFSAAVLPDAKSAALNIERAVALRIGDVEEQRRTLTNTSFRLISKTFALAPGATCEVQRYEVFAGPKKPPLLQTYGLEHLITYGWTIFEMVAVPLTKVLEFFYVLFHNYGVAIILLTVLVRLAMHPMSRKQAQNAIMMQKLQPEMKEIQKKFKKDPEAARKAQQELFSKHNYNPLGGCLLLFIQMPVFMGLYRALQVDVELRGAALIPWEAVRWCSNLAAPDMLYDWSGFMPAAVNNGIGFPGIPLFGPMLGLGPYLNLFPVITIVLFILQQKVMMPPAADEQAAATQKMMKYMMIVMGLMFFKVAAGLCIYFITSTLWGLAEKQFLPKAAKAGGGDASEVTYAKPKPSKPRLTEAERDVIRRQKKRK